MQVRILYPKKIRWKVTATTWAQTDKRENVRFTRIAHSMAVVCMFIKLSYYSVDGIISNVVWWRFSVVRMAQLIAHRMFYLTWASPGTHTPYACTLFDRPIRVPHIIQTTIHPLSANINLLVIFPIHFSILFVIIGQIYN